MKLALGGHSLIRPKVEAGIVNAGDRMVGHEVVPHIAGPARWVVPQISAAGGCIEAILACIPQHLMSLLPSALQSVSPTTGEQQNAFSICPWCMF